MGQYHEIWAFDPEKALPPETIDHYAFGAGAKLAEQAYAFDMIEGDPTVISSPYSAAVGLLLMGRWANRRVIVIGDYAEEEHCPRFSEQFPLNEYYSATNIPGRYHDGTGEVDRTVLDITLQAQNLLAEASGWTFTKGDGWNEIIRPDDFEQRVEAWKGLTGPDMVIASGRGEFFRPNALGSPTVGLSMPFLGAAFPAVIGLLACSDGLGGGDLRIQPAGRWAYTNVSIVPHAKTEGMHDITDWLIEQGGIRRMLVEAVTP